MTKNFRRYQQYAAWQKYRLWHAGATIAACLLLSGCSADAPLALLDKLQAGVNKVKDSSYDSAAFSIDRYCLRVPQKIRLKVRRRINERTSYGDIIIDCLSDR